MTITHSIRTYAGDGERAHHSGGGLTEFGHDLIAAMNDIGMLVDVSHLSVPAFWHAMQATQVPVVASHSSCRALNEHGRNLHDDQMKAIADGGGVIGVSCVHHFVDWTNPTLERYLDHVEHAVNVAGIDHVGFGSDFDGGSFSPRRRPPGPPSHPGPRRPRLVRTPPPQIPRPQPPPHLPRRLRLAASRRGAPCGHPPRPCP